MERAALDHVLLILTWVLIAVPAYSLAILLIFGDPDRDGR